jgi:cyclophilin family peptidyl-prolyl cis-trans isomerase
MKKAMPVLVLAALFGWLTPGTNARPPQNLNALQAEQALRQGIFEAEDSRAPDAAALKSLTNALKYGKADIRRIAVRALGRLERPALGETIAVLLADPDASVRAEAANALGQSLQTLKPAGPAPKPGREADDALIAAAEDRLLARLGTERDPAVRGALARTIGRLPYRDVDSVRAAEMGLLAVLGATDEKPEPARLPAIHGAAKGTESLLRQQARLAAAGPELVAAMKAVVSSKIDPAWSPQAREAAAGARRLALAALISANKLDESVFAGAAADPDDQVRRLAMAGLGGRTQGSIPAAAVDGFVRRGLQDASGMVRYEALRVYGRRLMASDAAPVLASIRDRWPHTVLLALDLLGQVAAPKDQARALLEKTARGLTANASSWHEAAHALVSLARIAPEAARPILPAFESAAAWPVRMVAARAAGLLKDEASLRRLAGDPHDNVREAALSALAGLIGHQADALAVAALARPDYQLIQTAARSLKQSPAAEVAVPALLAALDRVTGEKKDTSRDPRLALLERIGELATPAAATRIARYAEDFDSAVATAAAGLVERWTGRKPEVRPQPLPIVRARLAEVEKLGSAVVRVTMAGGGVFEFKLLTDEAPATAARFAALARAGYYNGLTFHRIVPNFVVQGGSPGANEIMGDGPYMRDEVGLVSHDRGTIGISTRGRDTGDAQLFLNVVDNPRLDHDYTVFARIVSGLDVADRILECAVIERIEIVFPRGRN